MSLRVCPRCENTVSFGQYLIKFAPGQYQCVSCNTKLTFSWKYRGLPYVLFMFIIIYLMTRFRFPFAQVNDEILRVVLALIVIALQYCLGSWSIDDKKTS